MRSQDVVAIILALCVVIVFLSGSGVLKGLLGIPLDAHPDETIVAAWEKIVFAIIGALSGYIAGKGGGK